MKSRRSFLTTVASGGVGLSLAKIEVAAAQSTPAPSPSASEKPPSAAALSTAAAMRAFDPQLTDADVTAIARGIDENRTAGARLNAKKKRLKNGDEPALRFAVADVPE